MTSISKPNWLEYRVVENVATITLNRPDKLNACTKAMGADFIGLIDRVDADDAVRALIITGKGRAFCAGADLNASDSSFANSAATTMGSNQPPDWSDASLRDFGGLMTLRLFDCTKPIIVAFNGSAAGMGVTLSLAADIRLCADTAYFTMPFVRRGILPESASSWFLPRIVGLPQALEWMLSGRKFDADEALSGGLVRSVHPAAKLMAEANRLAHEISDNAAPVSVALTRQLLWKMSGAEHPMDAHCMESRGLYSRARSSDVREGVDSFLEKRSAEFSDKVSVDMPDSYPWWSGRRFK